MGLFSSISNAFSSVIKAIVPIVVTVGLAYMTGGASLAIQAGITTVGLTFAAGLLAPKPKTIATGDLVSDPGIRVQMPPATHNRIPSVVGFAYTGGIIVDARISSDNQTMTYVFVMNERSEIADFGGTITEMLWNDQKLTFSTANNSCIRHETYPSGTYNYAYKDKIKWYVYQGNSNSGYNTTTPAYNVVPGWDSSYQLNGLMFSVVQVKYDSSVGLTGLGQCSWKISSGISDEPGSALYEYLINETWGAGLSNTEIDIHGICDKEWKSSSKLYNEQYVYNGTSTQWAYSVTGTGLSGTKPTTSVTTGYFQNPNDPFGNDVLKQIPSETIISGTYQGWFSTQRVTSTYGYTYSIFYQGLDYVIISLGTISQNTWNTIAGTTGVTYSVGSTFTCVGTNGTSYGYPSYSTTNPETGYAATNKWLNRTTPSGTSGMIFQYVGLKSSIMNYQSLNDYSEEQSNNAIYNLITGGVSSTLDNRYRVGGVLSTNDSIKNNIERFMLATNSWFVYDEKTEKWKVIIDKKATTTELTNAFSFTDKNILSDITISRTPLDNMYNSIEVCYNDVAYRDQKSYTTINLPASMKYPDEPERQLKMYFDLVNDVFVARRLGVYYLLRSRQDLAIEFTSDHSTFQITAGEFIKVTSDVYGWTNKVFRVLEIHEIEGQNGELYAKVRASEYDDAIYNVISPLGRVDTLYGGKYYYNEYSHDKLVIKNANNSLTFYTANNGIDYTDDTNLVVLDTNTDPTNKPSVININTLENPPYFDLEYKFEQGRHDSIEISYTTDNGSTWNVERTVSNTSTIYLMNNTYTERIYGKPIGTYQFRVRIANDGGAWSNVSPSSDSFDWNPNINQYILGTPLNVLWTASGNVPDGGPYGQTLSMIFRENETTIPLSNASDNNSQSNNSWRLIDEGIGQTGWIFNDYSSNYSSNSIYWSLINISTEADNMSFITPTINYKDSNGINKQYKLAAGYLFKA